jgi:hypothetical protein
MNTQNIQIEGAKAIILPQDWGHMLRLILATFPTKEIEERLFNSQKQKSCQKYLQNQVNEKHFST